MGNTINDTLAHIFNADNTALKLTSVEDGEIWGEAMHSDKRTSPCTLFWDNSTAEESITANGVIATLTFEVLEEAKKGFLGIGASDAKILHRM